jgi:hypothetical protein
MENRDALKIQGNFHTANTISCLSEKPFDYKLVLVAIPEKNPIWYILWILL